MGQRLEGFASVWQLSCDHEVGKDAGVEGAHGVGEEADVGCGGQQTCVAEVTCVVWRRAVLLSGGCFGARRLSDWQPEAVCGTYASMRQLGYWKLYAPGSWWTRSAW